MSSPLFVHIHQMIIIVVVLISTDIVAATYDHEYLGVSDTATTSEIRRAFRQLAKKWHPDHNPGCGDWCKRKMQYVLESYQRLVSSTKNQVNEESYDMDTEFKNRFDESNGWGEDIQNEDYQQNTHDYETQDSANENIFNDQEFPQDDYLRMPQNLDDVVDIIRKTKKWSVGLFGVILLMSVIKKFICKRKYKDNSNTRYSLRPSPVPLGDSPQPISTSTLLTKLSSQLNNNGDSSVYSAIPKHVVVPSPISWSTPPDMPRPRNRHSCYNTSKQSPYTKEVMSRMRASSLSDVSRDLFPMGLCRRPSPSKCTDNKTINGSVPLKSIENTRINKSEYLMASPQKSNMTPESIKTRRRTSSPSTPAKRPRTRIAAHSGRQ